MDLLNHLVLSDTPPLSIFMLLKDVFSTTLHAGPVMCYKLFIQSQAREQGKESTKPKWDTDMVWISAWDTELK